MNQAEMINALIYVKYILPLKILAYVLPWLVGIIVVCKIALYFLEKKD